MPGLFFVIPMSSPPYPDRIVKPIDNQLGWLDMSLPCRENGSRLQVSLCLGVNYGGDAAGEVMMAEKVLDTGAF